MFVLHDSAARTVDEELDNDLILEGVSDEECDDSDEEKKGFTNICSRV